MTTSQWEDFISVLPELDYQLLQLKQAQTSDEEIRQTLNLTPKKLQKRWSALLERAAEYRNREV